jgi:ubiquinone/menaquinone biosynthesis C-methylase UbiE
VTRKLPQHRIGPKPESLRPRPESRKPKAEGWHGWDEYAPFYDWENAQTLGRQDVAFWQRLARQAQGPILELGSGTGRVTLPVGRIAKVPLIGIDRSDMMLAHARRRLRQARTQLPITLVRGDIRALPFVNRARFQLVMAPYGILQSLVRESDLTETLRSVARVLAPGGLLGVDLVPDLPQWAEYRERVRLRGFRRPGGGYENTFGGSKTGKAARPYVTLVETVRQDRRRGLTIFDQRFVERRGTVRQQQDFSLTFRTLSVRQMRARLEKVGLEIEAILGDYDGGPWDPRADVWLILARRKVQIL